MLGDAVSSTYRIVERETSVHSTGCADRRTGDLLTEVLRSCHRVNPPSDLDVWSMSEKTASCQLLAPMAGSARCPLGSLPHVRRIQMISASRRTSRKQRRRVVTGAAAVSLALLEAARGDADAELGERLDSPACSLSPPGTEALPSKFPTQGPRCPSS